MVMYKIDRRGGTGGVQKSFTRTDPHLVSDKSVANIYSSELFTRKIRQRHMKSVKMLNSWVCIYRL